MADYLVQEDGTSRFSLEDDTGFLLLESSGTIIVVGRFDPPSPSGMSGEGAPGAGVFDPPSPGVTNA